MTIARLRALAVLFTLLLAFVACSARKPDGPSIDPTGWKRVAAQAGGYSVAVPPDWAVDSVSDVIQLVPEGLTSDDFLVVISFNEELYREDKATGYDSFVASRKIWTQTRVAAGTSLGERTVTVAGRTAIVFEYQEKAEETQPGYSRKRDYYVPAPATAPMPVLNVAIAAYSAANWQRFADVADRVVATLRFAPS